MRWKRAPQVRRRCGIARSLTKRTRRGSGAVWLVRGHKHIFPLKHQPFKIRGTPAKGPQQGVSRQPQEDKIRGMSGHRRMIHRRTSNSANRRNSKIMEAAPEGDGPWETGSAHTAISEEEQNQQDRPLSREEATALDNSNHTNVSPARGTLTDTTSKPNGGARGGNGLDSKARYYRGSSRNKVQPSYHPDAECSEAMGYAGRLSLQQQASLDALRKCLTCESVDLTPLLGDGMYCPPEDTDLALLRFLRHNNWDVNQTRTQVEASLAWRVGAGVAASLRREPWEASRCSSEETFEKLCEAYYPHYTIGVDRQGRPVLVQKYGAFSTTKLKQCTTLDGLLAYHAWEQEKNAELLRRSTARTGYLTETYTVIMDFKGMGIRLVGNDFMWLLENLSKMDRSHYPGRGGVIYVINTPPLFGAIWNGIRHLMGTKARVYIFRKEREWKAALAEAIDASQLPQEYGGTAPALADTPFLHAVHRALKRDAAAAAAVAEAVRAETVTAETVAAETVTAEAVSVETVAAEAAISQLDEETAVDATSDGDDVAAKTMAAILQHFSLDDHEYVIGRNFTSPVAGTSISKTPVDPPPRGSEGLSVNGQRSTRDTALGHETQGAKNDGGGFEWALSFIPGVGLAGSVFEFVAGNAFGATLTAAGLAASVMQAVIPEEVWSEGVQAFEESRSWGRESFGT